MAKRGGAKSMDILKAALADRQAKAQKVKEETGQTWIKRSVIEEQRREEYLEEKKKDEERQEAEDELRLQKFQESLKGKTGGQAEEEKLPEVDLSLLEDDDAEPPIGIEQCIERLRDLGHPITLFGETDMQRYKRIKALEKELHEGKVNPDLLMLKQNEQKLLKEEQELAATLAITQVEEPVAADDKSDSEDDDEEKGLNIQERAEDGITPAKPDEPEEAAPDVNSGLMDRCDFIRSWIRKCMKGWEADLANRDEEAKKSATTKLEIAQHRQCRRDIRPLQRRLKMYRLEEVMLERVEPIVRDANDLEYRKAAEAYLELSIGKAAWPVGIGCGGSMLMEDAIGLHDRFNRMEQVKDIAYLLNDDVRRKYIQALKRLMSKAQEIFPPSDPSKLSG